MKFVHIGGDYAVKDGVTFFFKSPSEVTNRSTIEKLSNDPSFRRYDEEENETPAAKEVNACPKCHKAFPRGLTMHMKFCKA